MSKNRFDYLINEKGNIQEEASVFIKEKFIKEVNSLLNFAEDESQLRLIGSVLNSIIQDMVSKRVVDSKK